MIDVVGATLILLNISIVLCSVIIQGMYVIICIYIASFKSNNVYLAPSFLLFVT